MRAYRDSGLAVPSTPDPVRWSGRSTGALDSDWCTYADQPGRQFVGEVTCLAVVGPAASMAGRVVSSTGRGAPVYTAFFLYVYDMGPGNQRQDQATIFPYNGPVLDCPYPGGANRIARGDVIVHDAP